MRCFPSNIVSPTRRNDPSLNPARPGDPSGRFIRVSASALARACAQQAARQDAARLCNDPDEDTTLALVLRRSVLDRGAPPPTRGSNFGGGTVAGPSNVSTLVYRVSF